MTKKYIVVTSIFDPTEAISAFAKMSEYRLIVVADEKTPDRWHCENVDFMSLGVQQNCGFELARILPHNHYCRKMLGYVQAIRNGAECIVDTDDDNIPKDNWSFEEFDRDCYTIPADRGFINIYQLYSKQKIWPRGLPLSLINKKFDLERNLALRSCKVGVWQGLADEDPDVDAIYRLTSDSPCYFDDREPVVLAKGTISPFNSQNTIFRREMFPLMYLPTHVTFRFTDILRGLVAQPIMWLYGFQLGFVNATVIQKRNPHDYVKDFISEIPMYEHCERVVEVVGSSIRASESIGTNLHSAYDALLNEGIVCESEILTLEAWLKDLEV